MQNLRSRSVIFMSRLVRNWKHLGCTAQFITSKRITRSYAYSPHENGKIMKRLNQYLEREKDAVAKLKNDFAEPYIDLDSVVEYVKKNGKHEPSKNDLYNWSCEHVLHRPAINMKFLLENKEMVAENIRNRKLPGVMLDLSKDIIEPYEKLHALRKQKKEWEDRKNEINVWMKDYWINKENVMHPREAEKLRDESVNLSCLITLLARIDTELEKLFYEKALWLPNMTHPDVPIGDEADIKVLKTVGEKGPRQAIHGHMEVGERTGIIHQKYISNFTGHRSYYLCDDAADLEQALVRFSLDRLRTKGFRIISGPNILHGSVFEGCGLASTKMSKMLYKIDPEQEENFYISGTSEVTIAAFLANHAISIKDLPMKFCCVSTCCRKETDNRRDPRSLYRVHHFTKVEMFGVTANETGQESDDLFQEFLQIQEELFSDLKLHFRIVNMPTGDLGLPAYQKIDMEAWMPSRDSYGEISSASNCTDFQSRRLHILYKKGKDYKFAQTVNGTACAVPRMIIALCENKQTQENTIELPQVLHPYLKRSFITKSTYKNLEYIGPNQSRKKWKMPKE